MINQKHNVWQLDYMVTRKQKRRTMDRHCRFILAHEINKAIDSISWPSTFQEPDYVAKLVTTLPGVIKLSLRDLLPGRNINVGGAFIHQKPLARFVNPPHSSLKNPELGDLLIVCREQRASGHVYNALLLQAKCTDDVDRTMIPADHQFILYSQWPEFEYVRAGVFNGIRRSICPKTITQGAQYLLIDKNYPAGMFTATVDIPLEGVTRFPCTLSSVIAFERGRTFQSGYPRDMWSNMIWDLLKISSNAVFNRRNSNYSNVDRWTGDSAFNFLLYNSQQDVIPVIDAREENGQSSGVSVICVDLGNDEKR